MRIFLLVSILLLLFSCQRKTNENKHQGALFPEKEAVFEGLNRPWSIAFLSEHSALVTEKNGHLVRINLNSKTKKVIKGFPADLADSIGAVHIGDNSGIYEVMLHPQFKENKRIYFSYAAKVETPDIVYHLRRMKVNHPRRAN